MVKSLELLKHESPIEVSGLHNEHTTAKSRIRDASERRRGQHIRSPDLVDALGAKVATKVDWSRQRCLDLTRQRDLDDSDPDIPVVPTRERPCRLDVYDGMPAHVLPSKSRGNPVLTTSAAKSENLMIQLSSYARGHFTAHTDADANKRFLERDGARCTVHRR